FSAVRKAVTNFSKLKFILSINMLLSEIRGKIQDSIRTTASSIFGIEIDSIAAEIPPKPDLGDIAFPIAFELAKRIKQATG
ncbi:hypothetical protein OFB47_33670, partial [Escherichia coli]|nr:hypothetical protein [Escherichia coli]